MSSSQSDSSTRTSIEEWCSTVEFHEAKYVWKIRDFSSLDKIGDNVESPIFSSPTNDEFKWYLYFEFRGEDETDEFGLFVYLSKSSPPRKVFAKSTFSFLNDAKEEIYISDFEYGELRNEPSSSDYDRNFGWSNDPKKDETYRKKYLKNDTLTISLQLTFFELNHKNVASMFRRCNISHLQHLSDNLASALENHKFADFTLSAQGKNYQVHKVILAARSKYFAKIFDSGMEESEQNYEFVENSDLNEDVMGTMLKFIYTGKCENLDKLADDLLVAADKYELDELKKMCVKSIYGKSLSVDNALLTLVLAYQYGADELKSMVIDFIIANWTEMKKLETWDEVMSKYPKLLLEMIEVSFSRLSRNS